jgi:hypothetical protein
MTNRPGAVRRLPPTSDGDGHLHVCERCGEPMEERHCKILCGNCGFSRDCSDP